MAGEIFISYRRADEAWARLLHERLRGEGIEAWYDAQVGAGQDWRVVTAKALEASHVFVLLFSASAARSDDIAKELAAAVFAKKLIVPVRLENIAPQGAFLYELASRNWINAYENTEAKLAELALSLARLVKDGIKDESILSFDRSAGHAKPSRRKGAPLAAIAAGAAIVALAVLGLFYALAWRAPTSAAKMQAAVAPAPSTPAGVSIAVLPFLNLSSDKDQEFFSDGMTEEITSALAKVPGLRVIGRSSAFQFKGQDKDVRAIGKALGVSNLIEGSVRKDGNQVRITAQLINASDGTERWTENYDRNLKGIFAVQEEIAKAIAGAMQVPLGLKPGENLVPDRTDDTDSYQDYLRARATYRARQPDDAIAILTRVVARAPTYAPAWALLSLALILPSESQMAGVQKELRAGNVDAARTLAQSVLDRAAKSAREAIRLDPRLAIGYAALTGAEMNHGNWIAAEDDFRRALALDSHDPDILYAYAAFLGSVGRLKDARHIQVQILAQEPFVPNYQRQAADVLWAMGQNDAALKILQTTDPVQSRSVVLAKVYATAGRYGEAADTLSTTPASDQYPRQVLDDAARLIRSAPRDGANPLPALPPVLNFVYLFVGAQDRYLKEAERQMQVGLNVSLFRDPWAPSSASLRKMERFKAYARDNGWVDYWRARGWPDMCRPVGADDFACK
jgi:TolB-like protein/Tfp pilus assembly protein PilF